MPVIRNPLAERARSARPAMPRLALLAVALASLFGLPAAARAQVSPSAFTSATRFDASRRVTGTIAADPDGAGPLHYAAVRNSYDPAGRLVRVETGELADWQPETRDPSVWTGFTIFRRVDTAYDAMDRKTVETVSSVAAGVATAESVTQYSYDGSGRLECTTVRMNRAAFASLPASACTPGAPGPDGPDRIARNVYDAAGQLLQVRKAVGTAIEQAYATYSYTPNGKQQDVVDANGGHAQLTYDGFDRLAQWRFPSPAAVAGYAPTTPGNALATAGAVNPADYEEYGYDANGNRTSLRKRDGTILTYAYDALDRMTQKNVPASVGGAAGYAVFYGYDNRGLELYARFGSNAGLGITDSYDGFGALASSATNVDGTARTLTSSYDADSDRIALSGDPGAWGYTSAYGYDGLDRLAGLNESGHPIAQLGYDPAGRRSSLALGFDAFTSSAAYGYDPAGRLQSVTHDLAGTASDQALTFAYNPASQIVSRTSSNDTYASNTALAVDRSYAVNGLNQYVTAGPATFAYDANGNLTGDGSHTYVYDAENRLVSASTTGGNIVTLSYDPMGRLWQVLAPSGTIRFLYDGDRLAIEYDSAGTLLRSYDHGAGPDEPLVWYEAASGGTSRRYLHADHQGSIVAVADQNGNPIAVNAYDEWGIPNASNLGRFGYTGQAWLPELGMWYYKARIYSPTLGRFLQTDPVGYKDQVNLYAYVGNDPVDHTDPTGEQRELTYEEQKQQIEAQLKFNHEHPKVAAGLAIGAAVVLTGGTALAVGAPAGAGTAVATGTATSGGPVVTEVTTGIAGRAANSLTAPTIRGIVQRVVLHVPKPLTGLARTLQPEVVPAAYRAAQMAKAFTERGGVDAMAQRSTGAVGETVKTIFHGVKILFGIP